MSPILVIVILIIIAVVAVIYNILTISRNKVKQAYSTMDASLQKRWDLVPNLVEVVKGYSAYEEKTLEKITSLRNQNFNDFKMDQKLDVDNKISRVVSKMIAISENYPDLKASDEYIKLSNQLMDLEEEIKDARKDYTEAVKDYNTKIAIIPNNIVAVLFGFNEEEFFEANPEEKQNVKIDL